jgi:hypothetical protein
MDPTSLQSRAPGRTDDTVTKSELADNATVGRQKLLNLLDRCVKMYNEVDFEALMRAFTMSCNEAVHVRTCLAPPTITNNRKSVGVLTVDDRVVPYVTQKRTVSSIATVWKLIHSAVPDGVMKIIDKRICYRAAKQPFSDRICTPAGGGKGQVTGSCMEVVATLCGTRAIQQSLHEVLKRELTELADPADIYSVVQGENDRNSFTTTTAPVQYRAAPVPASNGVNVAVGLDALCTLLTAETRAGAESNTVPVVAGKRWRYLIEFRLQFDEHDLVTHWTTTMLAAEPEEILLKPQLRG